MKTVKIILFGALLCITGSCSKHKSGFPIEETTHNQAYDFKIVENYQDALKAEIVDTANRSKESYKNYYAQNVDYLFSMGGGCFTPKVDELSAVQSNDTIKIYWKRKYWKPCPSTGKHSPVSAKIIINRQLHSNYKKMVFIQIDDN